MEDFDVETLPPFEKPVTNVIREAIINNLNREDMLSEIMRNLACTRLTAKSAFFAFLWFADEDYLEEILEREYTA